MINSYWIGEYIKVLAAYIAIMYVWPSVVFFPILHKKSLTYRFAFCTTVQVTLVSTVVLMLGSFHVLSAQLLRIIFYSVFAIAVVLFVLHGTDIPKTFMMFCQGTIGLKQICLSIGRNIAKRFTYQRKHDSSAMINRVLVSLITIFGVLYFSYGILQSPSYPFSDMNVHHSWTEGLNNGIAFSGGIYPEAMHAFAYAIHALFNIDTFSTLLYLAGVQSSALIIAVYIFFKSVFHWRFTPMLALTLFLTIDVVGGNSVYSMSRIQCSLPQEFGLFSEFLCVAYLIRYLRTQKGEKRFIWNSDLFFFMLSLSVSIATHFYVTIIAFFVCVAVVVFNIKRVFSLCRLVPLALSAMLGLTLAMAPMVTAYANGTPLQSSLMWALNIIAPSSNFNLNFGTDTEFSVTTSPDDEMIYLPDESITVPWEDDEEEVAEEVATMTDAGASSSKLSRILYTLYDKWLYITRETYSGGYKPVVGEHRSAWVIPMTFILIALALLFKPIALLLKKKKAASWFDGYAIAAASSALLLLEYVSPDFIPQLIESGRLCSNVYVMICAMALAPVDFVISLIANRQKLRIVMNILAIVGFVAVYASVMLTGHFHGFLASSLTQYNGAVEVLYRIIADLPRESYTIISPTDELYKVLGYGYHEEVQQFINAQKYYDAYYLPTKYVFVYFEKRALRYSQGHFASGPAWLANNSYMQYYGDDSSIGSVYTSIEVTDEYADGTIPNWISQWDQYTTVEYRTIWEARLARWIEAFKEVYPDSIDVYYEDDYFMCYCITQSPECPYNLVIAQ